jgi:nitrogen-specific signal transduction histidine kinase
MEEQDFAEDILYFEEIPGAVTVCDTRGMILYMNAKARQSFKGGEQLIGKNLMDCHPEPARSKLADLLENPRPNSYTIEKNSVKK